MKRILLLSTVLLTSILATSSPTLAAFDDFPGLRINALGGAAVADKGDPMGFFVNPASSAFGSSSALEMYYSKLFWGLENDNLIRNGIGGYYSMLGWGSLSMGHDRFDSDLYSEHRTLFGYSRLYKNFAFGLSFAFLGRAYQETPYTAVDPLFQEYGYSKGSFSVDLGTQWQFKPNLTLGMAIRKLNRPNQALEEGVEDPLPREYQFGLGWKIGKQTLFADVEYRDVELNGADFTPRLGYERSMLDDALFLRGGFNRDEISAGFGLKIFTQKSTGNYLVPTSTGATKRVREERDLRLKVAYTFRYPIGGISNTLGTHLFGMTMYFDRQRDSKEDDDVIPEPVAKPSHRDKVMVHTDTVWVPEVMFVEVEVIDTAKIHAYEVELLGLREEISSLRNMNEALGALEDALRLYYLKHYERAITRCDNAIRLVPTLALAYIRKGSILLAKGDYAGAKTSYLEALKHDPENAEIQRYLRQIEVLERSGR